MVEQFITPGLVIAVGLFLWQMFGKRFDAIRGQIKRAGHQPPRVVRNATKDLPRQGAPLPRREGREP